MFFIAIPNEGIVSSRQAALNVTVRWGCLLAWYLELISWTVPTREDEAGINYRSLRSRRGAEARLCVFLGRIIISRLYKL